MMLGLGRSLVLGGPVGAVSAETQQFLDRLPTLPSSSLRGHYNTFINGLVDVGLWEAFDALYLFSVETASASCVNIMQDRFPLDLETAAGTIEFTPYTTTPADAGWLSSASLARMAIFDEVLQGASNLVISLDDASIFIWVVDSASISGLYDVNCFSSGTTWDYSLSMYSRVSNFIACTVNCASELAAASSDGSGFFVAQRTSSTNQEIYRNNTLATTPATRNSSAMPSNYLGHFPRRRSRAFGFGRSLSSQERADLNSLISEFVTSTAGVTP